MRPRALHVASVLAVSGASGCTADSTTLAELGPTAVYVDTGQFGPSAAGVDLRPLGSDCPTIDADATATLNGLPMSLVARGGLEDTDQGEICNVASFQLTADPLDISSATIGRGSSARILVSDAGTTWTIGVDGLLTTDITMIGTPATNGTITLSWPEAGTSICGNHPCWNPAVVFFDGAGKLVTFWERDPTGLAPEIFSPAGSDWGLALSWATSASSMQPPPVTTTGSLVVVGHEGGGPASVCDGPSECHARERESARVYSATLF